METTEVAFDLTSTDYLAKLDFTVMFDDQHVIDIAHVKQRTPVKVLLDVNNGDHELKLIMKNKTLRSYGKLLVQLSTPRRKRNPPP